MSIFSDERWEQVPIKYAEGRLRRAEARLARAEREYRDALDHKRAVLGEAAYKRASSAVARALMDLYS